MGKVATFKFQARPVINFMPVNAHSALGRSLYAHGSPKALIASKGPSQYSHVINDALASTELALGLYTDYLR